DVAKTTTAGNAGKSSPPARKPRPSPTPTPTSSPTPAPTATTPPPGSGSDIKIPMPGYALPSRFGDLLVDPAHGHVYITGGRGTRDLAVTDLDGGNLRTIANVGPGAAGMTLSPDGSKLYVAASGSDGITIVDTTTFALSWYWTGTSDGTMT